MLRHMPDFNRDIVPAGGNHNAFGRAYLFANENVAEYIKSFDMRGKRVLSVAAGGDHAFESLLNGASFVDTFDINYAQKPIIELKTRMIKSLPYEDFMDFFFNEYCFFDKKIIEPIWNDFSPELSLYLDWFYCMGPSAPRSMFVYGGATASDYEIDSLSYLKDKQTYGRLAKILPNAIKFTHLGACDISAKIDAEYDFILLSNIFDYLDLPRVTTFEAFVGCYNKLLKPLSENNLSPNGGHILFNYIWNSDGAHIAALEQWNKFKRHIAKKNKTHGHKMHKLDIVSPFDFGAQDSVLYMTQNQKIR